MCMFKTPDQDPPALPTEMAQARQPNIQDTNKAGDKAKDQLRARASTVLTSGSGVTQNAATGKKTLLGQ